MPAQASATTTTAVTMGLLIRSLTFFRPQAGRRESWRFAPVVRLATVRPGEHSIMPGGPSHGKPAPDVRQAAAVPLLNFPEISRKRSRAMNLQRNVSKAFRVAVLASLAAGLCAAGRGRDGGASREPSLPSPRSSSCRSRRAVRSTRSGAPSPHKLTQAWGQSVVVENKPGAGGNIGADYVAKSAPDGYTMVMGALSTHAVNPSLYSKMPYDAAKDFAPITLVAITPNVLVVNPQLPVNSVKELIAYAKAHPGKLSFGSGSNGSAGHLAGELFKADTGADMVHIPFKGAAPAMQALLAGDTQLMFDNLASSMQQVKAGKLKALAVTTAKRSPLVPELPTMAESGVPGFDISTWFGLLAPAGTPPEVIAKWNADVVKILSSPEMREQAHRSGRRTGTDDAAGVLRLHRSRARQIRAHRQGVRREGGLRQARMAAAATRTRPRAGGMRRAAFALSLFAARACRRPRMRRAAFALSLCAALAPAPSPAQVFPVKPVRIVVPFPAGGTTDLIARAAAQALAQAWGQPVLVDNRPGARGSIGSALVAHAVPDGYTLLLGTLDTLAINPSLSPRPPYDPAKDFAPVILVATVPNVTSAPRMSSLPDIPTVARSGVPGEADAWFGLLAPAGTPRDVVAKINADTARWLASADARDKLAAQGAAAAGGAPEDFARQIGAESAKWAHGVKHAGAKPD